MKKTSCALLTVALLMAAGGAHAALPPLQLEIPTGEPPTGGCSYVFGYAGFDAQFGGIMTLLSVLGVEGMPESIWVADLDSVTGPMSGNGMLDVYELALLGAALCEADSKDLSDVLDQFNANIAQFGVLIDAVVAVFTDAGASALGLQMMTVGAQLNAWAAANPGHPCEDGALEAAGGLIEAGGLLMAISGALPVLGDYAPWFAGMGGLSSEMQETLNGLLGDLLMVELPGLLVQIDAMAAGLQYLAAMCSMPPPLPDDLNSLAANLLLAKAAIEGGLGSLVLPDFEIYGVSGGKTTEEPFSALGDYNEDGTDNLGHYVAVGGGGPDANPLRAAYVAAATSNQHLMPVAGGIALALLAGMAAIGGALVIRKK